MVRTLLKPSLQRYIHFVTIFCIPLHFHQSPTKDSQTKLTLLLNTRLIVLGSLSMLIGSICLSSMWDGIPTWLATLFLFPASIGQGLAFPAASLAVLATSTQEDQAVMTSTLILWRSLGVVGGVSFSSVILQNTLIAYLEQLVTGPDKDDVTPPFPSPLLYTASFTVEMLTFDERVDYTACTTIGPVDS